MYVHSVLPQQLGVPYSSPWSTGITTPAYSLYRGRRRQSMYGSRRIQCESLVDIKSQWAVPVNKCTGGGGGGGG